jgi:hypothetical protein
MRVLGLILLSMAAGFAQNANQVRDRGQTRSPDQNQSWDRGRVGTEAPLPKGIQNYSGILVDATCSDRASLNLREKPAAPVMAKTTSQANGSEGSSSGITVDPKTMQSERGDVLEHQVPDLVSRQPDPSCAITGSTREFALFTPEGRLLNLDEGGTTYAWQTISALPEGRAMLNGTAGGVKPQVTLRGRVQGDRLIVEKVLKP